jgi:hypothetical protein
MAEMKGKDFVALRRLSDGDDRTIAAVGETCERVPPPKAGGTQADALAMLLASGKIAPVVPAPAPLAVPPTHAPAIVDELHAHKTRAVWDVLDTATGGSSREPDAEGD